MMQPAKPKSAKRHIGKIIDLIDTIAQLTPGQLRRNAPSLLEELVKDFGYLIEAIERENTTKKKKDKPDGKK